MTSAFILRLNTDGGKLLSDALATGQLMMGWSEVDLSDPRLEWPEFVKRLQASYPDANGRSAGSLWRFVRDMQIGDYVVVPTEGSFHIARVTSPVKYDRSHLTSDSAYRRSCEWLTRNGALSRNIATSALYSRMKAFHTCVNAADLVSDVETLLVDQTADFSFFSDLTAAIAEKLGSGRSRLNERQFEDLVAALLTRMGASQVEKPGRRADKGDDLVAYFKTLGLSIVVQVKYYWDKRTLTDEQGLNELLVGMDHRGARIGWFVTCGKFDDAVKTRVANFDNKGGPLIRLIDVDELASLLVEHGYSRAV